MNEGLSAEKLAELVSALQKMDAQQVKTDEQGDREIAWFWWRYEIAEILGLPEDTWSQGSEED